MVSTGEQSEDGDPRSDAAIEAELEAGLALHQANRLADAERTYRAILGKDPDHPIALHLLGVLLHQQGSHESAAELIQRSIVELPDYAAAHYDLGNILRDLGRMEDAQRAFQRAIELRPDWPEAQYNYALLLEARRYFDDAASAYRRAIAAKPDYAKALLGLADLLRQRGQSDESAECYERLLSGALHSADDYRRHGLALFHLDRHEAALERFQGAIALKPDFADAHLDRGNALSRLARHAESLESYERAIALDPRSPVARINRGVALVELRRCEAALDSYDEAIALQPDSADAYYNRGNALADLRRSEAARESLERAIALQPEHAEAHTVLGVWRLQQGDFARGWGDYEWRWKTQGFGPLRRGFAQPQWRGTEALSGKAILLHAEQGLGDTLQFCRYVNDVAALGAKVTLEVQPALLRLLAQTEGAVRVLERGAALPPFDYQCPLMSLPLALGTGIASIPAHIPYLHAAPNEAARWKSRVDSGRGLKVGLVWAGGAREHLPDARRVDQLRSMTLTQFAPLARVGGVRFYSLQKGDPGAQARNPPRGMKLLDFTADLHDFADTAALVSNLDLVIGVDTSVIHLAGGMGVPVWTLSRFNGCWRWLLDRDDSPWYPSMRLFRQIRADDWGEVMERVAAALADCAASGHVGIG